MTLSEVPDSLNIGDEVTPKVNVKRADGTTPIEGAKVNFFVKDSHGTVILGPVQTTDSNGDATAGESYYVADTEGGTDIDFIIIVWPKAII